MNHPVASSLEYRAPLIGRVLQERYRVLRQIGRGGMGVVYLAEHVLIQRKFAIKVLHSQLTASEELVQRFYREARAATAAGDEHIVDVTDMGRLEDGNIYMVMEYLEGPDLATLIENEGPLGIERALNIGLQICNALESVHAAGIVHRDLKPENIVLVERSNQADFVKILDFGICKVINERPLTATGVALGTPQYMAPEQLEARREVDQRADIYSVGAVLFYALSGRNAFVSESLPELLVSVWSDVPPRLREVRADAPEALERTIARALEKQPDSRFDSVRDLAAELRAIGVMLGMSSSGSHSSQVIRHETRSPAQVQPAPSASFSTFSRARKSHRRLHLVLAGGVGLVACSLFAGWLYLLAASLMQNARPRSSVSRSSTTVFDKPADSPQPAAQTKADAPASSALPDLHVSEPRNVAETKRDADPSRPRKPRTRLFEAPAPTPPEPSKSASESHQTAAPATPESLQVPEPSLVPSPAKLKPVL